LNDLATDLNVPKVAAVLLEYRLKVKTLLTPESHVIYRNREKDLLQYFTQEKSLMHCSEIPNLVIMSGVEYKTDEWSLLTDSSESRLQGVLLPNANPFASVPVVLSAHLEETCGNLDQLLEKINYKQRKCTVCGDLQVLCMLLGQHQGYT
jgi:hypothetical protein